MLQSLCVYVTYALNLNISVSCGRSTISANNEFKWNSRDFGRAVGKLRARPGDRTPRYLRDGAGYFRREEIGRPMRALRSGVASRSVRCGHMGAAELRQAAYRRTVLLVSPGELQPEFTLRILRGGVAAGQKHAQGDIAVRSEPAHRVLQLAQFIQNLAGNLLQGRSAAVLLFGATTQ